jgi:hypothetical protein
VVDASSRPGSRRMKGRSSVRRGTAMYRSLPSARARARTGRWGAVGVALDHRAARHAGSEARRAAAADAPAKLGIRPSAPGKLAGQNRRRRRKPRPESTTREQAAWNGLLAVLVVGASFSHRAQGGGIWPDGAGMPDPQPQAPHQPSQHLSRPMAGG